MSAPIRVLLVDDEDLNVASLSAFLTQDGYAVFTAGNGREALEVFRGQEAKGQPVSLVLTDLRMPIMGGEELIGHLLGEPNPPVILIQSVVDDVDRVIQFIKQGVYDYLIKPYSFGELLHRVDRAVEYGQFQNMKSGIEKERRLRQDQRINWKGSGFGTLVGLLQRVSTQAKSMQDGFLIDPALMQLISVNAASAAVLLELFDDLDRQQGMPLKGEIFTAEGIRSMVTDAIDGLKDSASLRSHTFRLSALQNIDAGKRFAVEPASFKRALSEMLLNALKFSEPGSSIDVNFTGMSPGGLQISILSLPAEDAFGNRGILPEYENLVFDPFYRLSSRIHDIYPTHDLGLGLTLVDRIVRRHGGVVTVRNTTVDGSAAPFVCFNVELQAVDAV